MGCDIHIYTEVKLTKSPDWRPADPSYVDPFENKSRPVPIIMGRDYQLFAQLANVRNSTFGDLPYFDKPRGLPNDVTDFTKAQHDKWHDDAHSESYITYNELRHFYNQHPTIKTEGVISPDQKQALDNYGKIPTSYCAYSSDPNDVSATWEEPNRGIKDLLDRMQNLAYLYWLYLGLNQDKKLRNDGNRIRIVFWFDN